MKNVVTYLLSLSMFAGCAHQREKQFEKQLSEGKCDEALEKIPYKTGSQEIPGGKALSYGATAAAYTADVVITVTGGVLIFTALCGPTLALMMANRNNGGGTAHLQCIPADLSGLKRPAFGRTVYDETQRWRCPELTRFSESLRKVVSCYQHEGSKGSLEKASRQVDTFTHHSSFKECVKPEEKTLIESLKKDLDTKLAKAS